LVTVHKLLLRDCHILTRRGRRRNGRSGRERLRLSLVVGELKYDLWGLLSERKSRYRFLYVGDHNPHAFRGA
jgi:hypothetical protein